MTFAEGRLYYEDLNALVDRAKKNRLATGKNIVLTNGSLRIEHTTGGGAGVVWPPVTDWPEFGPMMVGVLTKKKLMELSRIVNATTYKTAEGVANRLVFSYAPDGLTVSVETSMPAALPPVDAPLDYGSGKPTVDALNQLADAIRCRIPKQPTAGRNASGQWVGMRETKDSTEIAVLNSQDVNSLRVFAASGTTGGSATYQINLPYGGTISGTDYIDEYLANSGAGSFETKFSIQSTPGYSGSGRNQPAILFAWVNQYSQPFIASVTINSFTGDSIAIYLLFPSPTVYIDGQVGTTYNQYGTYFGVNSIYIVGDDINTNPVSFSVTMKVTFVDFSVSPAYFTTT